MLELISPEQTTALTNEYYILHLLYHRGRNQHRLTVWWKYLNILHRYVRKIIKLAVDIARIKSKAKKEHKQKQIVDIIVYLDLRKVFTKAYYEFNGVIALGQFINLGLTLVGNLTKIWAILMQVGGIKDNKRVQVQQMNLTNIVIDSGDDLGEAITFEDTILETATSTKRKVNDNISSVVKKKKKSSATSSRVTLAEPERDSTPNSTSNKSIDSMSMDDIFGDTKKPKKKEKKKKKLAKSAMDDIFG